MPHTNYSTDSFHVQREGSHTVVRLNNGAEIARRTPDGTILLFFDSTAHGLTQYPAPMSDGKSNTKPGGEAPDQGAESLLHAPKTLNELGGAR